VGSLPTTYLISDRRLVPDGKLLSVIESLLEAGLGMLQLREKDLSAAELFPLALQLRQLTRRYNCKLLINDRVDLALAVEADGVHLGGHSLPTTVVRELLGPQKLIGVSTHSAAEISPVTAAGADFITFGPIFHTPSKAAFGAPVGLTELRQACRISQIPLFALGGINLQNAAEVMTCGADGVAMISTLLTDSSPADSYSRLQKSLCKS
jgi:thiamine-phosphate pyrophosphorylase